MPFCAECGTNLGTAKFCANCGTPTSGSSQSSKPQQQTQTQQSQQQGAHHISNQFLPGKTAEGDIEGNLSRAFGLSSGGGQPQKYTIETRTVRQNQASCSNCGIVSPNLFDNNGQPWCEKCLVSSKEVTVCSACGKGITDGVTKVIKDAKYHPDCLRCFSCSNPLNGPFTNRGGKLICKACATK